MNGFPAIDRHKFIALTKQAHIDDVPNRWARQYPEEHYGDGDKKSAIRRMLQLMPLPLKSSAIDALIGNTSWTAHRCDVCDADSDLLIRVGDDPDHDSRWLDICPNCIAEMAKFASIQVPA